MNCSWLLLFLNLEWKLIDPRITVIVVKHLFPVFALSYSASYVVIEKATLLIRVTLGCSLQSIRPHRWTRRGHSRLPSWA